DQSLVMCGLQAAAGLGNDVDDALNRETVAGVANDLVERLPRQQRHDEVRLPASLFLELTHVEDFDDVRVAHRLEDTALLVEELERAPTGEHGRRLEGQIARHGARTPAPE